MEFPEWNGMEWNEDGINNGHRFTDWWTGLCHSSGTVTISGPLWH